MHLCSELPTDRGNCLVQSVRPCPTAWDRTILGTPGANRWSANFLLADTCSTPPEGVAFYASLTMNINKANDDPLVFSTTTYDATAAPDGEAVASIKEASGNVHTYAARAESSSRSIFEATTCCRDGNRRSLHKN